MTMSCQHPCAVCNKAVRNNQKTAYCNICCSRLHIGCSKISSCEYNRLSLVHEPWFCKNCVCTIFPFNWIEDDLKFLSNLFTVYHSDKPNADLIINEAQLDLINENYVVDPDIDPDLNHQLSTKPVQYFLPSDFNKQLGATDADINKFSILHINAQSLNNKIDDVINLIDELSVTFSIITVSETWANEANEAQLCIPNYDYCGKPRIGQRGGGVAIYVRHGLNYDCRNDLDIYNNDDFEFLAIQLHDRNGQKKNTRKNIVTIYRPPGKCIEDFIHSYTKLLDKLSQDNCENIITGDFNINLLNYMKHHYTENFLNLATQYHLYPTINRPTRFGDSSASLIDNIFIDTLEDEYEAGLIISDLSDHLPIFFVSCRDCKYGNQYDDSKKVRDLSNSAMQNFSLELAKIDWGTIQNSSDVDAFYDEFLNIFGSLYDKCFPPKVIARKPVAKCRKPWITSAIAKSIKRKNKLHKAWLRTRNDETKIKYKVYKNKLTHILRCSKSRYYIDKFTDAKHDMRKTWGIVNKLVNRAGNSNGKIKEILDKDRPCSDKTKIAHLFNEYFISLGSNLASKFDAASINYDETMASNLKVSDSLFLAPTDDTEILGIIRSLKPDKSPGFDEFSPRVIKAVMTQIARPLTDLFNLSINQGVFPSKMKMAKVCPVFKAGDKRLTSNYRPISVLPVFSKILERLLYSRLMHFLESHNILAQNQYGFREKHSTYMALLSLTDHIAAALDNKQVCAGVFMDLSKAFDTVNHNILLYKLSRYGIRGIALNWFASYLAGRSQYVQIDNTRSSTLQVSCGVPQGSILGPLLFLVYINDLIHVSKVAEIIMFADDTTLFFNCAEQSTSAVIINNELDKISCWFRNNRLTLNIKKTNFILFRTCSRQKLQNMKITIDGIEIEEVTKTKFLGVVIDQTLTWRDHITLIKQKLSKNIGILSRLRYNMPRSVLLSLYHAMIEPYLTYCNIVWAIHETSDLKALFLCQKKSIRVLTFSNWRSHTKPLFSKYKILTLYAINKLQVSSFMYRATNNMLPGKFCSMYKLNSSMHSYCTRARNNVHVVQCRTNVYRYSMQVYGTKLWNSLPTNLRQLPSLTRFRNAYINFLCSL